MVFSALLRNDERYKTVFYAHEVATARLLVEGDGGHDTRFYNVLRLGSAQGRRWMQVFGDQSWFYKHAMILRAGVCDRIFAVGDPVVDELRFLGGVFRDKPIDLVYNGVPAAPITLEQKLASRELMLQYAENLYGYRPDYIFTHVTRMVPSKALWRDVRVLEHLEWTLAAQGKRAVTFVVSTASPPAAAPRMSSAGRRNTAGRSATAGITATCKGGEPLLLQRAGAVPLGPQRQQDLPGEPVRLGARPLRPAHARGDALRRPAHRHRPGVRPVDLRAVRHRPGGAAELAARCAWSPTSAAAWGSSTALRRAEPNPNLIVADYVSVPPDWKLWSPWDALRIDERIRNSIEARNSYLVAQQIAERLPQNDDDRRRLLEDGQRVARG